MMLALQRVDPSLLEGKSKKFRENVLGKDSKFD